MSMDEPYVLLDEDVRKQIKDAFQELDKPVEIALWRSPENETACEEAQQLLKEIVSLDERLTLEVHDLVHETEAAKAMHITHAPSFSLLILDGAERRDPGLRFLGIPTGHEFAALIHDLIRISGRDSGLAQTTRDFLGSLKEPVFLQVFSTPT